MTDFVVVKVMTNLVRVKKRSLQTSVRAKRIRGQTSLKAKRIK